MLIKKTPGREEAACAKVQQHQRNACWNYHYWLRSFDSSVSWYLLIIVFSFECMFFTLGRGYGLPYKNFPTEGMWVKYSCAQMMWIPSSLEQLEQGRGSRSFQASHGRKPLGFILVSCTMDYHFCVYHDIYHDVKRVIQSLVYVQPVPPKFSPPTLSWGLQVCQEAGPTPSPTCRVNTSILE